MMQKKKKPASPKTRKLSDGQYEWTFTDYTGKEHSGIADSPITARAAVVAIAAVIAAKLMGEDFVNALPPGLGRDSICLLVAIAGDEFGLDQDIKLH